MRRHRADFQLHSLEQRTLFSVSPASQLTATAASAAAPATALAAAATSASDVLTKAARQQLLNHLQLPNQALLQKKLDTNKMGAFDGALLDYMRSRPGETFFWKTSDVSSIAGFIDNTLATSTVITNANHVLAHQFPDGNSQVYDVKLPAGKIDWSTSTSNPEFQYTLNRHEFWLDLSQAYVLTGDARCAKELTTELISWSQQNPALANPGAPNNSGAMEPLSVASRSNTWTWVYQQVLGKGGWAADTNTLFLSKLYEQGDRLRKVTPYALTSNRSLFEGQALMQIAQLVPEFDLSSDWKAYGRGLLFGAMDAQLNADGGHAESTPGYAENVVLALLEMYWLDQKKGDAAAWSSSRLAKLQNAAKAHVELLSPDGKLSALSDTYRSTIGPFWDRPRIILSDTADFPAAKPRLRDVWLFGASRASSLAGAPVQPGIPARGNTFSMPQSGYYVMRSGQDSNARQVIFDAGPTGGTHGHFDLLSFELFGYGHPLISDPGFYMNDGSQRRIWSQSTAAHNTINVDGLNHAAIEGVGNPDINTTGISNIDGGYQITASHQGYKALAGAPVVSRSLWYDGSGVMLIADRGQSQGAAHTFGTSFLLPGTNTSRDLGAGWIHSNNASGNVKIQTLLQSGQSAHRQNQIGGNGADIFTSSDPDEHPADDATRFYVDQTAASAGFVTLVTTYSGANAPNITAKVVGSTTDANGFQVQIYRNGVAAELIPFFIRPGTDFRPAAPSAGANDIAWDAAGRLHLVFNDRADKTLKYSVRDAKGNWSAVQTIDPGFEAGGYPSLAVDSQGIPSVAYFDGNGGDLKFAKLVGGGWQVQTVDSAGSVGLYPSMVLASDGSAIIGYYKRTGGDLKLAVQKAGGWKISTIDAAGDVGRCTSLALDPNDAHALSIAYDDSNTGAKKFAHSGAKGWTIQTVDNTTPNGGGYTSLAYEPFKDTDGLYHPAISYYDSSNSALKFARQTGSSWASDTVIAKGAQGLYTSLTYDAANRPNIFFFKKTNNTAYRAVKTRGSWTFRYLDTGGRELQTAKKPDGSLAYTNLDADGLRVDLLAS